ncbi:hypothetical protein HAX54_022905 [Datura stramonium]|uniref:Uncharacterized protein n=1 Tax=Datura stramonium TaxID=4076 RepID=A0ABS8UX93_DATST|nr:hypothetical protein [Datura stramonium]
MLMEEEKFEDEMDPQEMSENPQLLRGRTLSRLVDEIFSPFRILSPHTFFALFHRGGKNNLPSGQRPKFPLDSFLSLLCCSKMISPRVLERRESGKNLSYSVTEKSDDSSVTQGDPTLRRFFRCIPPPSFGGGRKGTLILIHSRAPER